MMITSIRPFLIPELGWGVTHSCLIIVAKLDSALEL